MTRLCTNAHFHCSFCTLLWCGVAAVTLRTVGGVASVVVRISTTPASLCDHPPFTPPSRHLICRPLSHSALPALCNNHARQLRLLARPSRLHAGSSPPSWIDPASGHRLTASRRQRQQPMSRSRRTPPPASTIDDLLHPSPDAGPSRRTAAWTRQRLLSSASSASTPSRTRTPAMLPPSPPRLSRANSANGGGTRDQWHVTNGTGPLTSIEGTTAPGKVAGVDGEPSGESSAA